MNRRKNTLKLMIFLFGIMFFLGLVSGAVVLKNPASSGTVSGQNQALNTTFDSFTNVLGCTWYASSVSTANSTAINISSLANSSADPVFLNVTVWNTTRLEDSNDYSVYASCTNMSDTIQNSTASTSVTVNNTIPTTPSALSPASGTIDTDGTLTISATVVGRETTQCLLFFVNGPNFGGPVQTMSHTGNSCSLSLTSSPEQTYRYIIEANDGTNRVNSTETSYQVDSPNGGTPIEVVEYVNQQSIKDRQTLSTATNGSLPTILVIAFVVFAVAFWIARRK